MDSSEYDEYPGTIRVPKGARLAQSKKTTGAHRGLTRDPDTNELVHAEIFLKEEDQPDPVVAYPPGWLDDDRYESEAQARERQENAELLAEVLVQIGLKLAEKAAPHIRRLWSEWALPTVKAKWSSAARGRRMTDRRAEATDSLQEVVSIPDDQRTTMSGAEAQKRFAAAVIARIYSDGQLRLVRNARVVEEAEDGPVELGAMGDLTPQRIGEHVALLLETDPSLLGGDTLAELGKLVAEIRADGGYVPIPRVEGALPHDGGND